MTTKTKNIPVLRFPKFEGEWFLKKLGNISTKTNSGKTPLGGASVYSVEGVLFIRSQNVVDNKLSCEDATYISEAINSTMQNSIVEPRDILLNITGASLGRSCVVPLDFSIGNVNQHVCIIRVDKYNEPSFIQPIFASEKGQTLFNSLQTGSGREGLNFQSIKGISLFLPSLPEQQKIATFLTAIDTKINQLTRKKQLLEQYKKGVMQKIFNQELRFKNDNGVEFLEWEEKKLGDILVYEQPTKYLVSSTEYDDSFKTPVLTAGKTFILGYTNEAKGIYENDLPVIIFDDFTTSIQFVDFPFKVKSTAMKLLHPKKGININFVFEAMKLIDYAVGGHERHWISKYSELFISFPCDSEQQKIATFLTAIDNKITQTAKQLEQTQTFKKGLLQQMFV